MKKFSSLLFIVLSLITFLFVTGCTYADNATLLSIQEKYNTVARSREELFSGSSFKINFSDDLNFLANSQNSKYTVYKTDNSLTDFTNRGEYSILMQGVNSTYLYTNAFSILENNNLTEKKYKKNMYLSLESLEKNSKKLLDSKTSLESVFENNTGTPAEIAEKEIAKYNLNKFNNNLNNCLKDLYKFNKNYNMALNNNISKPIKLEDLLYSNNLAQTITLENNIMLIHNLNLLISNYTLNYSIDLKNDILDSKDLLNQMALLLNERYVLSNKTTLTLSAENISNYKLMRVLEDSLVKGAKTFENACQTLNKSSFENSNDRETFAIETIEKYYNELLSYSTKLISYLQSI